MANKVASKRWIYSNFSVGSSSNECATSETITTLVPTVTKVIDVIIPNGVSIINQQILDELPTPAP